MPRGNVRDQIPGNGNEGRETSTTKEIEVIEGRIKKGGKYYGAVSPTHVSGEYFVAMAMGYLHARPKLAAAAVRNPGSFLAALSECARLGLVLGETYHCVPFWDDEEKRHSIVGITDYKGEIELMYRSGGVKAVIYDVIYERDYFKRGRRPSEEPEFSPLDEGLAPESERGPLRGVFAYAILDTGAISHVVVMGRDEVMKHREVAKTKKVWDGPFGKSQWIKSAIKELRKGVPTSPEYRFDQMRAIAAHQNTAPQELAAIGASLTTDEDGFEVPAIEASAGTINGDGLVEQRKDEPKRQPKRRGRNPGPKSLPDLFGEIGVEEARERWEIADAIVGHRLDPDEPLHPADETTLREVLESALVPGDDEKWTPLDRLRNFVETLRGENESVDQGDTGRSSDSPSADPTRDGG